jgi:hypothetical protein
MNHHDAILILGGGLTALGEPTPWVVALLERALKFAGNPYLVVLGAGTPHKPPPIDISGYPVNECAAMARYLIERGCAPERIVMEPCSADTIGNAYFARVIHVDPRGWKSLAVVTSKFHMKRSKAIFRGVFSLPHIGQSAAPSSLEFAEAPDVGIDQESLASRVERERLSLTSWLWKSREFDSMQGLSRWIFSEHECYAPNKIPQRVFDKAVHTY